MHQVKPTITTEKRAHALANTHKHNKNETAFKYLTIVRFNKKNLSLSVISRSVIIKIVIVINSKIYYNFYRCYSIIKRLTDIGSGIFCSNLTFFLSVRPKSCESCAALRRASSCRSTSVPVELATQPIVDLPEMERSAAADTTGEKSVAVRPDAPRIRPVISS